MQLIGSNRNTHTHTDNRITSAQAYNPVAMPMRIDERRQRPPKQTRGLDELLASIRLFIDEHTTAIAAIPAITAHTRARLQQSGEAIGSRDATVTLQNAQQQQTTKRTRRATCEPHSLRQSQRTTSHMPATETTTTTTTTSTIESSSDSSDTDCKKEDELRAKKKQLEGELTQAALIKRRIEPHQRTQRQVQQKQQQQQQQQNKHDTKISNVIVPMCAPIHRPTIGVYACAVLLVLACCAHYQQTLVSGNQQVKSNNLPTVIVRGFLVSLLHVRKYGRQ